MVREKSKLMLLLVVLGVLCVTSQAQEADTKECVSLRMIEQKPAPPLKEKPAPDVIVAVPDDLHFRFELKNNCSQTMYYLAFNLPDENRMPAGFFIYRNKNQEWKARTPTWRREGSLTDSFNYHWIPLKTGESVEFEYSDLSRIEGERSIAIYVNPVPRQEGRVELLAEPFMVKKPLIEPPVRPKPRKSPPGRRKTRKGKTAPKSL
jgi:hypothetical protein